jgi:multidrug efflux pump subunit AcrA (membrane-fusion protein)
MPDAEFEAVVSAIGYMPASESDTVSTDVTEFEVVLDLVGVDARLRPGMTVEADITTAQRKDVVTCPLQALGKHEIEGKMRDTVFVLDGDRAKVTPVRVGISDGTYTEITEGLEFGQVVITGPYKELRKLRDGDVVEVVVIKGDEGWSEEMAEGRGISARGLMRAMPRRR